MAQSCRVIDCVHELQCTKIFSVTVCERLHWEREVNPEGTGQSLQQSIQFQNNANSSPEVADSSHNSQHPSRTTQCPIPALECVTINSADEDVGEHPSISDMFKLSQPLPSRKHSQVYIQEEINSDRISNPENLALNLDDENLFLPLSFQEFGYQTQNRI